MDRHAELTAPVWPTHIPRIAPDLDPDDDLVIGTALAAKELMRGVKGNAASLCQAYASVAAGCGICKEVLAGWGGKLPSGGLMRVKLNAGRPVMMLQVRVQSRTNPVRPGTPGEPA